MLIKPTSVFTIEAFTDVDWVGEPQDRRSTHGYSVYFGENLVQLTSRKQKVVALSSIEVEYKAISQALINIMWIKC